jgi:anti-sigma factor RsiW
MHPTDEELQSWFDEDLTPPARATVHGHLDTCSACSAKLALLQSLRDRLHATSDMRVPTAVWSRVRLAMPGHSRSDVRAPLLVAAAVLLFLAGYAVGQMKQRPIVQRPTADVASEVQRTGSAYVGALATLATLPESYPTRRGGREAALGAFRGAAVELTRLAADDDTKAALERAGEALMSEARMSRRTIHF